MSSVLPRRRGRRSTLGVRVAVAIMVVLLLSSLLAPWIAPHDPIVQDLANKLQGPSWEHPLGTDNLGRDVLSRLMWGGRNAFAGVAICIGVAMGLGIPWGTVAGFWPKYIGSVLMRICDVMIAFPLLVLAIAITGSLGTGLVTSMVAVGLVLAPNTALMTRAGVLTVRDRDFVASARLSGVPTPVLLVRHVLPTALRPVVIQLTIYTGLTFVIQGALAFLGLGPQRPTPSWGSDLNEAYAQILSAPLLILPPGILLGTVVLCVYRIGDALRDRMSATSGRETRTENEVVVA